MYFNCIWALDVCHNLLGKSVKKYPCFYLGWCGWQWELYPTPPQHLTTCLCYFFAFSNMCLLLWHLFLLSFLTQFIACIPGTLLVETPPPPQQVVGLPHGPPQPHQPNTAINHLPGPGAKSVAQGGQINLAQLRLQHLQQQAIKQQQLRLAGRTGSSGNPGEPSVSQGRHPATMGPQRRLSSGPGQGVGPGSAPEFASKQVRSKKKRKIANKSIAVVALLLLLLLLLLLFYYFIIEGGDGGMKFIYFILVKWKQSARCMKAECQIMLRVEGKIVIWWLE